MTTPVQQLFDVTTQEAECICRELFQMKASATRLPGELDRNFHIETSRGEEFVLKMVHPDRPPGWVDLQNCALQHIQHIAPHLPVPRVLPPMLPSSGPQTEECNGTGKRNVQCLSFLKGRPLRFINSTAPLRQNLGRLQAHLNRALENFSHPAEPLDLLWDSKRLPEQAGFIGQIKDQEAKRLTEWVLIRFQKHIAPALPKLRRQIIHNDFNPDNILVQGDDIAGVIDFGDLVRSPLIQDVATACAYQATLPQNPLPAILDVLSGFHSVTRLQIDELSLVLDFIAARQALTILVSSLNAAKNPHNTEYLLRNLPTAVHGLRQVSQVIEDNGAQWLIERLYSE